MTLQFRDFGGLPLGLGSDMVQPVAPRRHGPYFRMFKRVLDVVIVLMASLPVLAVILPMALLVARDGGSPFYTQERLGRHGKVFRIWKMRTMVMDADARLEAYLASDPEVRAEWDAYQKLRRDPRITEIGRILRKTSLDELPQLWNVLKGDMSIVGPRPMMPSQREIYPGSEYYEMRPGITGFWQVSVRNESNFAERAQFDRRYFMALSLPTDLSVILKTVKVVLKGTGS